MPHDRLTEDQWAEFEDQGVVRLGAVAGAAQMDALRARIDAIMLGTADVDYSRMLMQLDSDSGKYEDAGEQSTGHKGATLNYRKIQDLEFDPLFLTYMQHPVFADACRRLYGAADVACYRAMFMNKPAGKGTFLPWHQDRWTWLDRDPLLTIYTALDAATPENGCVQVIPGSHKRGLINPDHPSGFLTPQQASEEAGRGNVHGLELKQGEVALLHNWLLHASDVNRSPHPRRAFSVCCMDARTIDKRTMKPASSSTIFGHQALSPTALAAARL